MSKKRVPVVLATRSLFGESQIHHVFIIPENEKDKIPSIRYEEGGRSFTKQFQEYIKEFKEAVTVVDELKMEGGVIIHL